MKPKDITQAGIYWHAWGKQNWLVQVYSINPKDEDFNGRATWTGIIAGTQDGIENGSPCWGYCSELSEVRR